MANVNPDDKERGVYKKFIVERTDGDPKDKHIDCFYFVLDMDHDPFALPALDAYADACQSTHPGLAADVRKMVADKRKERSDGR